MNSREVAIKCFVVQSNCKVSLPDRQRRGSRGLEVLYAIQTNGSSLSEELYLRHAGKKNILNVLA